MRCFAVVFTQLKRRVHCTWEQTLPPGIYTANITRPHSTQKPPVMWDKLTPVLVFLLLLACCGNGDASAKIRGGPNAPHEQIKQFEGCMTSKGFNFNESGAASSQEKFSRHASAAIECMTK